MTGVVVVSPHLDDAVLSAWLVLAESGPATVVSCFAGVPDPSVRGPWDARTGSRSAPDAVATRRAEDIHALGFTGSRPVHLDLLDEQYRDGAPAPHAELVRLLRDQCRGASEVWLPAGLGGHTDHLATRDAGLAAIAPGQRVRVYADLPYAGQPGWPVQVTGAPRDLVVNGMLQALRRPERAQEWRAVLDGAGIRADVADRHVVKLTRPQFRAKLRTLRAYESQLAALRCGSRHPLRERRLFAYEVYWAVEH
jgi:LmbE family N-acetylglucosaminyl deacetylase